MPQVIPIGDLPSWIDKPFVSDWTLIDQQRIDDFARVTGDDAWIHVDIERARALRGTTITHGLLTLTLLPGLGYIVIAVAGHAHALNDGKERVRFTGIVPVDSRARLHLAIVAVEPRGEGILVRYDFSFEREGDTKPVLVGQTMGLFFRQRRLSPPDGKAAVSQGSS